MSLRSSLPSEIRWWPASISSSTSVAGSAFVPTDRCFPRPEGESHTRGRLPCSRSRFQRLPERMLPLTSGDVGQRRFLVFRLFVSPCLQVGNAARNQTLGRRGPSPKGCRRSPGLRSKAVSGRIDAHLENHLWPSRHLDPEGYCPRPGAVPSVVQFSKQGQSGEPRACSGRLRPSRVSWPASLVASRTAGGLQRAHAEAPSVRRRACPIPPEGESGSAFFTIGRDLGIGSCAR